MRLPDWDVRLVRWATSRAGEPFAWGRTDCVMLCLEAFEAVTGVDVCTPYRGKWHSRSSALRYQREHDFHIARILLELGCVDVQLGFQQRGDLIVIECKPFPCAHVCFGERALSSVINGAVCLGSMKFGVPDGLRVLRPS